MKTTNTECFKDYHLAEKQAEEYFFEKGKTIEETEQYTKDVLFARFMYWKQNKN